MYLTFNDAPSGIFSGQVIDVCRFWNEEMKLKAVLVAFISIRGYSKNKMKLRSEYPGAIVLPMFPKTRNWRMNRFLLRKYIRRIDPDVIVARGPFATLLALHFRKERRICFDARGAYSAELMEYNVVPDEKVKKQVVQLERRAVLESDFRLAVSNELVKYWEREFGYSAKEHVVIPCTLNSEVFLRNNPVVKKTGIRNEIGARKDDTLIVYSGSSAEWQSLSSLDQTLGKLLERQKNIFVVLLCKNGSEPFEIQKNFAGRVKQMWVRPDEVSIILDACDYGWLVREESVTNQVASPVKFAEYLFSGLKVIISEHIGDYSEFVIEHKAGFLFREDVMPELIPVPPDEKRRMQELAQHYFTKQANESLYRKLLAI
jgi:glycosyltransferase involved in cell wall biosynthesis